MFWLKTITLQCKILSMFSYKWGHTSDSKIAKKILWGNDFCNNYEDYYKEGFEEFFSNNVGQDHSMCCCSDIRRCAPKTTD